MSLQTLGDCVRADLGSGREGSGRSLSEGRLKRSASRSGSGVGDKLADKEAWECIGCVIGTWTSGVDNFRFRELDVCLEDSGDEGASC